MTVKTSPNWPRDITPPTEIDGHRIVLAQFYNEPEPTPRPPEGRWAWFVWAFFGNDKDGPIGDTAWNPERRDSWWVRLKWWLRNPAHNWCWHVKGFTHEATLRYDAQANDQDGRNLGWTERLAEPGVYYPFTRHLGRYFEWYRGWRGTGAWGLKFKRRSHK